MQRIELRSADGVLIPAALHDAGPAAKASVILCHGITVDMDEEGMFVELASVLKEANYSVLRFDFRGHGASTLKSSAFTITGAMHDLWAALVYQRSMSARRIAIVASSFGAVPVCTLLPYFEHDLKCLVLWNPVLDIRATFVNPQTKWGKLNFGPDAYIRARSNGESLIDGKFAMSPVLLEELKYFQPNVALKEVRTKTLILHGDQDEYVPYECSREAKAQNSYVDLFTVMGSDHGFPSDEDLRTVIAKTKEFIDAEN